MPQLEINENTLSKTDTTDKKHESRIWFWSRSANEISSDFKEDEHSDMDESDNELEKSKIEKTSSPEIYLSEIKWNKKMRITCKGVMENGCGCL